MHGDDEEHRQDWIVCGRFVGTGTGWDQVDNYGLMIYDFEPATELDIPKCRSVVFLFEEGLLYCHDDDKEIFRGDLIEMLAGCEKRESPKGD